MITGKKAQWQSYNAQSFMKRRVDAAVAPISPSEIVIFGGTEAYNIV